MLRGKTHIVYIFLWLLLFSCREGKREELLYPVVKSDFSDEILLEGTVEAVHSSYVSCARDIIGGAVIYSITEDGTIVQQGDTVCVLEHRQLMELKETVEDMVKTWQGNYEYGVANLESQYANLQSQAKSNEVQAALSKLDSVQMEYYSPSQKKIAELNLRKAQIQKEKIDRNLAALKIINETELKKLKLQLNQGEQLQDRYQELLDMLVLTAPASGVFTIYESPLGTGKYKEGDALYSLNVAEIPDPTLVRVRVQASELAYKRLVVGQKTTYTFSGMPANKAYGSVQMKAPVGTALNRTSTVKFFDVLMSVDSFNVIPVVGLSANCLVSLNHLPDTLVVPIVSVFDKDSLKVVYVKENTGFIAQEVMVGLQSSRDAVITAGLKGGEKIAMICPEANRVKGLRRLLETGLPAGGVSVADVDSAAGKAAPMEKIKIN